MRAANPLVVQTWCKLRFVSAEVLEQTTEPHTTVLPDHTCKSYNAAFLRTAYLSEY